MYIYKYAIFFCQIIFIFLYFQVEYYLNLIIYNYSGTEMPQQKHDNLYNIALKDFMGVTNKETLLILCDEPLREIGIALFDQGKKLAKDAYYLEIKPMEVNGQEPADYIARLMQEVDVVICATTKSLTHTDARRNACAKGTRVGTMPGITVETVQRCFSADYNEILDTTARVQKKLAPCSTVRVETKLGTNLVMPMKDRNVIASTGVIRNPGEGGNLPSGEVYLAPWEGKTNGVLAIDGSIAGIGIIKEPVFIEIVDGMATKFTGGEDAKKLQDMLDAVSPMARSVAEFGFGTNYKAQICGKILEDEKVLGTIHIAFGNNVGMGGNVNIPIHIDGIVTKPTVYFDDEVVMEKGKLLI